MTEYSIEEKIGQLIIPRLDFNDPKFDAQHAEHLIRKFHIGNFIVFGGDVTRVIDTLNHLQRISKDPILFSADLERGLGQQVKGATEFPYFMGLAEAAKGGSDDLIFEVAQITAVESRAVGIHQNFSPVLDINNNRENPIINIRSFGEDAETVTTCGLEYIKGLQKNGMLATAKHFPGHGDTQIDSHEDLPVLQHSAARLEQIEFQPFRRAIEEGVDAIMVGHIAVPSLEPSDLPATMSKRILTDLIRAQWNYTGLIVTDAMMMGAIANRFSEEEAISKVFAAGADQILIPVNVENACRCLKDLIQNNPEALARLDKSVDRILHAKKKSGLFENRFTDLQNAEKVVGSDTHKKIAQKIIKKSLVIRKGEWPDTFLQHDTAVWLIKTDRNSLDHLKSHLKNMTVFETEVKGERILIPDLEKFAGIIIITDAKPMAWQKKNQLPEAVRKVMETQFQNKEHLLISCGNPYIGDGLEHLSNFVCTFSSGVMAQEEIADRIRV